MKIIVHMGLFRDVRLWIFIFFIVRLYGITNPPLEVAHNWRQVTVTMPARNFLETDNNIFLPRVDFAGEKTGITGMEFPLLNYLIYLVSLFFGYDHWYGRLINLMISSGGVFFFYRIINDFFDERIAFHSALLLLVSLWFSYSRKVIPETFATSLVIAGLYAIFSFVKTNRASVLFAAFLLLLAGIMSKISSGYLAILLVPFLIDKSLHLNKRIALGFLLVVILAFVYYWYFIYVPYLVTEYGFWHFFMGKEWAQGLCEIHDNLIPVLKRFYETPLKYSGFLLFLFGTVLAIKQRNRQTLSVLMLCFLSFLPFVIKSGTNFSHHSYYVIPFIPVMCLVAGYGLSLIANSKIVLLVLFIVCSEGVLNQISDFRIKDSYRAMLELEPALDKLCGRDERITINTTDCPTPMYFAHRKGWLASNDSLHSKSFMAEISQKGCRWVVVLKKAFGEETYLDYKLMDDNPHFKIYRLRD